MVALSIYFVSIKDSCCLSGLQALLELASSQLPKTWAGTMERASWESEKHRITLFLGSGLGHAPLAAPLGFASSAPLLWVEGRRSRRTQEDCPGTGTKGEGWPFGRGLCSVLSWLLRRQLFFQLSDMGGGLLWAGRISTFFFIIILTYLLKT